MFEGLIKHVNSQKAEADDLRSQLNAASEALAESNSAATSQLERVIVEEREQAATDRENLLRQITTLVMSQGERQDARVEAKVNAVKESIKSSETTFEASRSTYNQNMDAWNEKEQKLVEEVHLSRESLKTKLKEDWIVRILLDVVETLLTYIDRQQAQCIHPIDNKVCPRRDHPYCRRADEGHCNPHGSSGRLCQPRTNTECRAS